MPRPVKWSRDLYLIRERASRSKVETWGRRDVEDLFGVGRATAQTLMRAVGEVRSVGAAHFVERTSLLAFLDEMIAAPSVDEALRRRVDEAEAPPIAKPLRVALPHDLRNVMVRDLPENIRLSTGRLEIVADSTVAMLESLAMLAQAMQNDLEQVRWVLEARVSTPGVEDGEMQAFLGSLRGKRDSITFVGTYDGHAVNPNRSMEGSMANTPSLIASVYAAFNKRDADGVLAHMSEDVSWPKASEGGRVVGKEEIRAYWDRQWKEFDPCVEPMEVIDRGVGKIDVRVHQVVKSLGGEVLADGEVWHFYVMRDGLIERMDLEEGGGGSEGKVSAAFAHR